MEDIPENPSRDDVEFARLLSLYMENNLTDADSARLRAILFASSERRTEFTDFAVMRCALRSALLHQPDQLPAQGAVSARRHRPAIRTIIFVPLLTAAAILLIVFGYYPREKGSGVVNGGQPAGTIVQDFRAKWISAPPGATLYLGRQYQLKSGYVRITLVGGRVLLLQGPARFRIPANRRFFLADGKVVVTAVGGHFTVLTPTAIVHDLGTRFAVRQSESGRSLVGVYEGRVTVRRNNPAAPMQRAQLLTSGQASAVTRKSVRRLHHSDWRQHFARSLSASPRLLNMVDLICGGDGTTNRRGGGVNVSTGICGIQPQIGRYSAAGIYHRITMEPVLDGCFAPKCAAPMPVDSAGDKFTFTGKADAGFFLLWAGGPFPKSNNPADRSISPVLGGVDYSAAGRSIIYFHPNKGITFNLDRIHGMYPADRTAMFTAVLGDTFAAQPGNLRAVSAANVWVIVDGKPQYVKMNLTPADGAIRLRIPLHSTDHFLTIADTAAHHDISRDWIVLGNPQFKLIPR